MRRSQPFILAIPKGIIDQLNKVLESERPDFNYRKEYFYYLINYLIVKDIINSKKKYHAINKKKLKSITTKMIGRYVKYLHTHGLIESDSKYISGIKSYHYKLNKKYLYGTSFVEINNSNKIYDRMVKKSRLRNKNVNRLAPHLKAMQKEFMNLDLDYDSAYKWIDEQEKKAHLITSILMLQDKRLRYFKRNKTNNRLDTNITNLKSNLRQFFLGNYISIDLKNSQPFFLMMLIKGMIKHTQREYYHIPNVDTFMFHTLFKYIDKQIIDKVSKIPQNALFEQNEELLNLENAILKGEFYDNLQSTFDLPRKEVKKMMFEILFSRNLIDNRFIPFKKNKKIFASKYPLFARIIKTLKSKKYKNLAIYLQSIESYIFIDLISAELVSAGIIPLTIHDSIIIESKDYNQAIKIVENVFKTRFGVIPTFHIKPLKNKSMKKLEKRFPEMIRITKKKQNRKTHKYYLQSDSNSTLRKINQL